MVLVAHLSNRAPKGDYPRIVFKGYMDDEYVFTWQTDKGISSLEWESLCTRINKETIITSDKAINVRQSITVHNGSCVFATSGNEARTITAIKHSCCLDAFREAARITREHVRENTSSGTNIIIL